MLAYRTFARTALATAGTLLLPALAAAQGTATVCFNDAVPLQPTNWNSSVTIPKFDPSLGTLQSIQFTISGTVQGQAAVESLDAAPTVINTSFSAQLTLTRPDLSVIVVTIPIAMFSDPVTAFDGTLDFGGTSGVTHPGIIAMDSDMATSPPPLSDLVLFTGPGTISLPVTAAATSIATGPGNVVTQFMTSASATVQVCYTYEVNQPPVYTSPVCNSVVMATAGVAIAPIMVCANDVNTGDSVSIAPVSLPAGATFTPNPATGNPACGTLEWTPGLNQLGDHQICFVATDTHGRSTTCCITISVAECYQMLGRGAGNASVQIGPTLWQSQLLTIRLYFPVTLNDRPNFRVPLLTSGQLNFSVQTLMHNTVQFPQNSYQWSNRLRVTVLPGGIVTGELNGTLNGIHQSVSTFTDPNGDLWMTFPFTIDGM
jgi:hypothetical protein